MKPYQICLILALGFTPGLIRPQNNQHHLNSKSKEVTMSVNERNKEAVRQLFEEVINKGRIELLKDLIADDYTGPRGEKGAAGYQAQTSGLLKAFPDIHYTLEELVGGDDKVAVRWTWRGTHKDTFNTIPPTGKSISNEGMAIYRCRAGKVIGVNIQTDRLGFLQQLDIVPANPAASSSPAAPRFIDKFFVPAAAIEEFRVRTAVNRRFIKTLPGFIKDAVYEYHDENGNLICITVAEWESMDAINKAKEAVQAEYKKEGFNPAEMMQRLKISMDRGIYRELKD
jgi:steroid delta-isomerase-like uncharacterized protein